MMKKKITFTILLVTLSFLSMSQDLITKINGDTLRAVVHEFKDTKFTLILDDGSMLIIPASNIQRIEFRKTNELSNIQKNSTKTETNDKSEVMDIDCESKKIGNARLINKSGQDTRIRIQQYGVEVSYFQITASTEPTILYNVPEGPYAIVWEKTVNNYTSSITGTFYIKRCKTVEVVIGKQ